MTEGTKQPQTTGKAVRSTKGEPTATPESDNRAQVHQGNIPVLTIRLIDKGVAHLGRIADALEKIVEKADG